MEWDDLFKTLETQQADLQLMLAGIEILQKQMRPNDPSNEYLFAHDAGTIISGVMSNRFHATVPLGWVVHKQIEFNKTVLALLTDLDYRKSESP